MCEMNNGCMQSQKFSHKRRVNDDLSTYMRFAKSSCDEIFVDYTAQKGREVISEETFQDSICTRLESDTAQRFSFSALSPIFDNGGLQCVIQI